MQQCPAADLTPKYCKAFDKHWSYKSLNKLFTAL